MLDILRTPSAQEVGIDESALLITLAGTETAPGEVDLVDLVGIGSALQELSTRVGREMVDRAGPGRTADVLAQLTRLHLRGVGNADEAGTTLHIGYGSPAVLPFEATVDDQVADLLWEVLEAIARNSRPGWAGTLVAESAVLLNRAFERAATRVSIQRGADRESAVVSWRPREFLRSAWLTVDAGSTVTVSVAGKLNSVDLSSGVFRMLDDFGRTVSLDRVTDPEHAALLIGQRVLATGTGIRDRRGDVRRLESAQLEGPILPEV